MELYGRPPYVLVPFVLALIVVFFVSAGAFLASGGLLVLAGPRHPNWACSSWSTSF